MRSGGETTVHAVIESPESASGAARSDGRSGRSPAAALLSAGPERYAPGCTRFLRRRAGRIRRRFVSPLEPPARHRFQDVSRDTDRYTGSRRLTRECARTCSAGFCTEPLSAVLAHLFPREVLGQGFEPWSSARKAKMIGRTTPTERTAIVPLDHFNPIGDAK